MRAASHSPPDPLPRRSAPAQPLPHTVIAASAGSGKTFRLAHRYVRLLADGVPPDRIAALTFSRKAAGEIFESVVGVLCRAAAGADEARTACTHIAKAGLAPADFAALLRGLLDRMPRLHIETLDSFLVSIVRAFPAELGLPAEIQVTDEHGPGADERMQEALNRLFDPRGGNGPEQRAFFEAFKQATFGSEEKRLVDTLAAFVDAYRETYRLVPEPAAWGNADRVWPDGCPWPDTSRGRDAAAETALQAARNSGWPEALLRSFTRIVEFLRDYDHNARWDGTVERIAFFPQIMALVGTRGGAELSYNRKTYALDPPAATALRALARNGMGIEIHRALRQAGGICRVLARLDALYDTLMRQSGVLTFSDAHFLLSTGAEDGRVPSRLPEAEHRLYIDYRLDCRLDHWLIDEFQDTSDLQWAALRNLVDELLQDESGRRSFFYVGDVKQAIYRWRGGNPRLFGEVLNDYRDRVQPEILSRSYRSCPPVLDTVNAVFGALPETIPAATRADWDACFAVHTPADAPAALSGYAALVEPSPRADKTTADRGDTDALIAGLLRTIRPVERALSAAVLVRSNAEGRRIVAGLRAACPGLPVVHEGAATLVDNPVVSLLLALLRYAAHPGDTLAAGHVRMSPLADAEAPALLRTVHERGFQACFRHWGRVLDTRAPLDAFGRRRLGDLLEAAARFDAGGPRAPDVFLRFIARYQARDSAEAGAVRVMTIHQSKGLGFDVVILPELRGRTITQADAADLLVARDPATHLPAWVLRMPRRAVAQHDARLAALLEDADARACFDALCVLYVALTRAKRALYMLGPFPGKTSKSYTAVSLLRDQLAGEPVPFEADGVTGTAHYETGRRDWFAELPAAARTEPAPAAAACDRRPAPGSTPHAPASLVGSHGPPPQRAADAPIRPSAADARVRGAGWLFGAETRAVLDFGQAIHELFEAVEWSETCDPDAVCAAWDAAAPYAEAVRCDAAAQFRSALGAPEVRGLLARPDGSVRLWREKAFDLVLDGARVSGVFDRVVLRDNADGKPERAVLLDYKSDRVETDGEIVDAVQSHRDQLGLYVRALSVILSLPPDRIDAWLVFTRPARCMRV
jgi:ATP-dependent helicase/nuclease subunit A